MFGFICGGICGGGIFGGSARQALAEPASLPAQLVHDHRSTSRLSLSGASPRPVRRGIGLRHSLSARLLWLTVIIVTVVEVMILLPSLGRERETWLMSRVREAHLAALTVSSAPHGVIDLSTRNELLRLSGTEAIRLIEPGRSVMVLPMRRSLRPGGSVDLTMETLPLSTLRAILTLAGLAPRELLVTARSPLAQSIIVQIVVRDSTLARRLRVYAFHIASLSLAIALLTGLILYLALDRFLVLPMRRLTESISSFRADPEYAVPLTPALPGRFGDDEIALAARELAAMQTELRAALWRNARLAALGTAVAKISHDLRNILSSALLVADRLGNSADPAIKHASETLIDSVERAAELVGRTLSFAREGPPPLLRTPVHLAALVAEIAESLAPMATTLNIAIDPSLAPRLDRTQIYRALSNLIRNAAEAEAKVITVTATAGPIVTLTIADDGPGLPDTARANLFRPFTGSARRGGTGLGLAIARDLVRAHGGELELVSTGPAGTMFRMTLPAEGPDSGGISG
jgi:signal transduction histidine kinase